jgi:hypothetical protein
MSAATSPTGRRAGVMTERSEGMSAVRVGGASPRRVLVMTGPNEGMSAVRAAASPREEAA